MKPLRILEIGHSYVIHLNRCVPAALARTGGAEVTVAAPAFFRGDLRPNLLEREPSPPPYDLKSLPTRLSRRIHVFWYRPHELKEVVRSARYDLISAWEEPYILAGYQIARAARATGARFCFRTAQSLIKRYPPPFTYFEQRVLDRAQGWIAGGELVHRAMLAKGFGRVRSRVIPLGVNVSEFQPASEAARAQTQRKLELEGPLIGFVGRLVPQKGIRVLMRALEQVKGRWSLLMLGSGPLKEEVQSWAHGRGWSNRVRIQLATHSEVPQLLSACDLLVAPSQTTRTWAEQFGRMVIEAFACRVPVIASDSGEIPLVVGDAGKIVPEADPAAWAQAIDELLDSPSLRAQLADAGQERCLTRFSAEAVARARLAYYRELMDVPVARA